MGSTWFFFFLKKALSERKGRFVISASAVLLAVTIITALMTLSSGIREKIGRELTQYGANMIVTDASGREFEEIVAREISGLSPSIRGSSLQVFGTAFVGNMGVEVIGMEPGKMSGFRVKGSLPLRPGELMVGVNIKGALNKNTGDRIGFDRGAQFAVSGIFEKGSDEDSSVVMALDDARDLLGLTGVSAVLLNVDSQHLASVEKQIRERFPFLAVKTIRQVAVAEERILGRIQLLMLLVTVVVLISSVIALGSTMGANVIERTEEIGLLKAIGATRANIRNFFMLEAALAGLAGALVGWTAGVLVAEAVSKTAFGSFVPVQVLYVPVALLLGVCIAVISTFFPVRDATRMVPAKILRGE